MTVLELEPVKDVPHSLPKGLVACLEAFEMDARHARHVHTTEAVEALRSEKESLDATYRMAKASVQDSRDEVFWIANALPQVEWSEFLGRAQF